MQIALQSLTPSECQSHTTIRNQGCRTPKQLGWCQMYEEKGNRGWAPGGLGMLSQVLLLPPGLLGEVAATASGNGGQTSRCHPRRRPGWSLPWVTSSGFLSDWGDTLCGFLMSLGSQASFQPSAGRWQELFVCLPIWLNGLAVGWSDLAASRQSIGIHLKQPTPQLHRPP